MEMVTMRNADRLLIVSIALLAVYYIVSILVPDLTSPIIVIYDWLFDMSMLLGYLGAFIISFIGNTTILFPIPYMIFPFILGGLIDNNTGQFLFDPWIIGIVAGLGAMLGEMTGYLIGYGGGQLIEENQRNSFRNYIENHPRATPLVIWFLAVSPIPDDFLIIPLGAAKYSWWKVAIPQFIGKSMFMIAAAWAGRFSLVFIEDLLGNSTSITSRTIEVLALLSLILGLYFLARYDWNKLMTKNSEETSLANETC